MSKIGEVFVEIGLRASLLNAQLGEIQKNVESKAKKMENTFKAASLRFNDSMAKKSIAEIEQSVVKLRANLERKIQMGASLGELEALKSSINKAENAIAQFGHRAASSVSVGTSEMGKFESMAKRIGERMLIYFGAYQIINFFKSITIEAAKFEEISSFFKGSAQDMTNFRNAVKGTVSDMGLMRLSNQANDLGVVMKEQPLFFAMAKRAAEAYGTSAEEGFQRVIMATEGNIRGLKAVGVQKVVYEKIVKDLAKAHGGLITEMDAETTKQIRLEAVIKASGITMEEVNNSARSHADRIEAIGVKWDNLKMKIGGGLTPFFSGLMDTLSKTLDKISELGSRMAGLIRIAGGEIRQSGYAQSVSNLSPDQLNQEREQNLKNIESTQKAIANAREAMVAEYTRGDAKNTDTINKEREILRIEQAKLNTYKEQQAVLVNVKAYLPKEDASGKTGGGLSADALLARAEKNKAILKEYHDSILEMNRQELEKELENSDKVIQEKYNKLTSEAKAEVDLEKWKSNERIKISDKYLSDQAAIINDGLEVSRKSDSLSLDELKTAERHYRALLDINGSEKERLIILSKIAEIEKGSSKYDALGNKMTEKKEVTAGGEGYKKPDAYGDVGRELDKDQQAAERFANTMSGAFAQGAMSAQGLGDILKNIVVQLTEMVMRAGVFAAIMAAINPSNPLGFIGFFGKALGFAQGGAFSGGMKLASGGGFNVPAGFDNDSFRLNVQSRELVKVYTPQQQATNLREYSGLLEEMKGMRSAIMNLPVGGGSSTGDVYLDGKKVGQHVAKGVTRTQTSFTRTNVKVPRG